MAQHGLGERPARLERRSRRAARREDLGLAREARRELAPLPAVLQLVRQVEAVHRVLGVDDEAFVLGGDARAGELVGERGAADQDRALDAGGLQVLRRHHHHLRRLDEQAREPDRVRLVRLVGAHELVGRHLDAEIDHPIAVVAEDDLDQVLADVVHVALDGGEDDRALVRRLVLLHVRLEIADGGLHRLGRLQHLGDDQLVGVEQPPDLVHAGHERAVDDLERPASAQRLVEVLVETFFRADEDVAPQTLVERQRLPFLDRLLGLALAEVRRECRDRVLAAPPDEVLGELPLLRRDLRVALELLRVDDRHVEPGLDAVVEEDRVQHLAALPPGDRTTRWTRRGSSCSAAASL